MILAIKAEETLSDIRDENKKNEGKAAVIKTSLKTSEETPLTLKRYTP